MSAVARRYAKAIFALADEQKQIEALGRELLAAARLLGQPELAHVAASPLLSVARRKALVDAMGAQLSLSPLTEKFLLYLAEQRRLGQLGPIADQYQVLEDRVLKRMRLQIRSAAPLPEAQRREIIAAFERASGKAVMATETDDDSLLGGVVVEAEGRVYDGSLRTQLQRLAAKIAGVESHT